MRHYSFDEMKDKYIGKEGSLPRRQYELKVAKALQLRREQEKIKNDGKEEKGN